MTSRRQPATPGIRRSAESRVVGAGETASEASIGFGVLFLLLLVAAGWWLHSRWSALRDVRAARRQAEAMFIMEARLNAAARTSPQPVAPVGPGDPTLPGK